MPNIASLQFEYYGNPLTAYLLTGATFLAVVLGFLTARRLANRGRPSLATDLFDQIRAHELIVVALDFAVRSLDMPQRFAYMLHVVAVLIVAWRAIGLLSAISGYAIRRTILSDPADRENYATAHTATLAVRGLIWLGAALFVLSRLGFNVTSMLAGLGIGGIAVALAAQAVLSDLFAALALYLDKPFTVGDMIQVGDSSGIVEHIGIKTTRVRSLSGEMLVYPNSALTSSRIQNFRQMRERRVLIHFSVPLETPTEALKKIPEQARAIVEKLSDVRFDRAHFSQYQKSGLQFELVFFVLSPDYVVYMDRQQSVLLELLGVMRADGIALAQPTTVMIPGKPV